MMHKNGSDVENMMAEMWIKKRSKRIRGVCLIGILLCLLIGCGRTGSSNTEEWKKQSATQVASQIYTDGVSNSITYYCARTEYYEEVARAAAVERIADQWIDQTAIETVLSLKHTSSQEECMVGEWPAILCENETRSYLCWTISPEYSCVIEYDADAVAEEDIFCMAASVVQQR